MHIPVLLEEVINYLNVHKGEIYVDCTLGLGGHSIEILKKLNGEGILIGIEQDSQAFEIAKERLKELNTKNYYLFNSNYLDLRSILAKLKINKITGGILLDLGVNSLQFNDAERGFSFRNDGPMDMRMDKKQKLNADFIVNNYSESNLAEIIYKYGEERYSRRIARSIIKNRPIKSSKDLANLICNCYPKHTYFKTHPATKTFQALRIEVNKELENLEKFLCFVQELLSYHSRLTVISFHSLEDRIIKNFLKNNREFKILTKKPVVPSREEIDNNPRSRSAKLRAAEKTNEILFKSSYI